MIARCNKTSCVGSNWFEISREVHQRSGALKITDGGSRADGPPVAWHLTANLSGERVFICDLPRFSVPRRKCQFSSHDVGDALAVEFQHFPHVVVRSDEAPANEDRTRFYRHELPHRIASSTRVTKMAALHHDRSALETCFCYVPRSAREILREACVYRWTIGLHQSKAFPHGLFSRLGMLPRACQLADKMFLAKDATLRL